MKKMIALALCLALPSFAADWTDANGNQYTALKSIKGNGSGATGGPRIITDIWPAGTDTVKLRFKPTTVSGYDCLFCTRNSGSGAVNTFSGFRAQDKIRIDRYHTSRRTTCNTTLLATNNEYAIVADFNKGNIVGSAEDSAISINGDYQVLAPADRTDGKLGNQSYKPAGPLMLFASHTAGSELSESSPYDYSGSHYLYYFQLYSSTGALKHNLMPAQDANGVAGLYDTVGRKFYGPVGPSGYDAFTADARTVDGAGVKWTGLGGDNRMSTGANWEGGVAPAAGQDIDFTRAVPLVEINADIPGVTFGKLWLDDGDIPAFTGSMTVSAVNLPLQVAGNPSVTVLAGDYTWSGGAAAGWGDAGVWTRDGAAATWVNDNNAVFSTAAATATLTADVTANALSFTLPATIAGANTLTVPSVSVAPGVVAVISAPTAGELEKTGAGTLVLSQGRDADTAISEGTLELAGSASVDVSRLTLGKYADKPVTLRIGPHATLANLPASDTWNLGMVANVTSAVYKAGGDLSCGNLVLGRVAGAVTAFHNEGGDLTAASNIMIGHDGAALSTMTVSGGTVCSSATVSQRVFVGYTSEGVLTVTNAGVFSSQRSLFIANRANGTVNVSDGGQVLVGDDIVFSYRLPTCGVINLGCGGTIEANRAYMVESGSATFNFDGGTFRRANTDGDIFAANGNGQAIDVTVSVNGGTIDNNGFSVDVPRTIAGAGGLTLAGSGTTAISAAQAYLGTTTVSNGTTLAVSGVAFAGPLVLEVGSSLEITNYTAVVPAVSVPALTLPFPDSIPLTFNGGAFPQGVYAICSAAGVTAADGAKFSFATDGGLASAWSLVGSTLVLTVGSVSGDYWTGLAGDGKMSSAANWASGSAPLNGADIDFSAISASATISADIPNATFGMVTMGEGVITFTDSLAATGFSDTSRIAVGENSTVTVEGDLVYTGSRTEHICHTVAEGGRFVVTGDIVAAAGKKGYLYPSATTSIKGVIAAKGLVNNATDRSLLLAPAGNSINWEIGENGISGSSRCYVSSGTNAKATVVAVADFTISGVIEDGTVLELDTTSPGGTPCTVTVGNGSSGYIYSSGCVRVSGTGRVLFNSDSTFSGGLDVLDTATLAAKPGAGVGSGAVTVGNGATLEVAASGTATIGGGLALADGASLVFNFTDRETVPALALADGNTLSFIGEGATNITVKCSSVGGIWPRGGKKALTACGGFAAGGVSVSLATPAPAWVRSLLVDGDGNIVLDVIHKGLLMIIK